MEKIRTINLNEEELEVIQSNDLYLKTFCSFASCLLNNDKEGMKNIIKYTHGTQLNKVLISIKRKNKGE